MKKTLWLLLLGLALLTGIAFVGCDTGTGTTPPIVEPEPIPPTFEEIVVGKFWRVEGIERYQDTRNAASLPYEKEVCMLWGDEIITAYEDLNDDGFLSPGEEIATVPYTLSSETITMNGVVFTVESFDATGWSMKTYLDGTTDPSWIGDIEDDWTGWIIIHYIPCNYPWLDETISFNFAFVFDDMGDTTASWDRFWNWCKFRFSYEMNIDFDYADAFYFTSGTPLGSYIEDDPVVGNHIVIIDFHDPFSWLGGPDDIDSLIVVYTEAYGMTTFESYKELKPDHVYDMYVEVTSADNATFTFVSRVDGSGFTKDAILDFSEMGELIIRAVDDCDVPVVNPSL